MKKAWVEPRIEVQKFVPQEYCAVCPQGWQVACDWTKADPLEEKMPNTNPAEPGASNNKVGGQWHEGGNCNHASNQVLIDNVVNGETDGIIDGMVEINSQLQGGTLPCDIYTDDTYTTKITDYSIITPGDYIFWTSYAGERTWHHQGRTSKTGFGLNFS